MNLLKTSLLTGFSTIIKILSGIIVNKIVAIYIGPAGIALLGQFQNVLNMVTTLGNGAINSGITKYVAEYKNDRKKRDDIISAGIIITFVLSILVGGLILVFSNYLSGKILHSRDFSSIFKVLGITLFLTSFNTFLLSLLNGLKKIRLYIIVNISSSLISLVITIVLTIKYHVYGALLSSILIQAFVLIIALPSVIKLPDFSLKFNMFVNKEVYMKLFTFSLMAVVSIITVPITQIAIRNYIMNNYSIVQAGYWQAVSRISDLYLMVLTTAFSTYYLPKLSELQSRQEIRKEIFSGYKIIIPFVLVSTFLIYILKDFIIWLLFTPDFIKMRSLFFYQLVGDFFKMASWTLAYLMVAKAMIKTYIITEILFSASYYFLVLFLTKNNGFIGVTQAFALNYFLYFFVIVVIFYRLIFIKNNIVSKNS